MPSDKKRVVSFDIDGTMEFGEPPGKVTVQRALWEKKNGNIIGSASDRPVSNQEELWKKWEVEVDFIVLKHNIQNVKDKYDADEYWHIGDSEVDRFYSERAGFTFFWAHTFPEEQSDPDFDAFEKANRK